MEMTVTKKKLKTPNNSNKTKLFTGGKKRAIKMLTFNLKSQTLITKGSQIKEMQ